MPDATPATESVAPASEQTSIKAATDPGLCRLVSAALHGLGEEVVAVNAANGWNVTRPGDFGGPNKYRIPGILALIHSEVSEALEAYRKGDEANFAEELADVFIRVIDLSHGLGIDLAAETLSKLDRNRARGFRHGGKRV